MVSLFGRFIRSRAGCRLPGRSSRSESLPGLLRVLGEPVTNIARLRIMRIGIEDPQIVGTSLGRVVETLVVEVGEHQVRPSVARIFGEQFLQFGGRILHVTGLLKRKRE